jgi:uncharacterized repeat protein (TIGR01451 family)
MRSIITASLLFVASFTTSAQAQPQTYIVDAVNGDDNLPSGPWRTISKVNTSTFQPGDSILFTCGQVWRETLAIPSFGTTSAPITFGSNCGATNKPVIRGADAVPASAWSQYSGNIYSAPVVFNPSPVIILNDTFDANIADWGPDYNNVAPFRQLSCPPTGSACMGIPVSANAIRGSLSVAYGKSYTVKFTAKTAMSNQTISVGVRRNNGDYHFIEDFENESAPRSFTVDPSWKTYEYSFTAVSTEQNIARMDIDNRSGTDTIYVENVSITEGSADVQQVFVDGVPLNIAHYPNNGSVYFTISAPVLGNDAFTTGTDLDNALSADGLALDQDFVGAGVHLRTMNFAIEDRKVYSYSNKLLTFDIPTIYTPPASWGYYLDNKVWMLGSSTTGGWAYDRNAQRLYVKMPDGSNPAAHVVEVGYRGFGVYGANRINIVIDGLRIQRVGTGVEFSNSDNFTVSNTDIVNSNFYGVRAINTGNGLVNTCILDQSGRGGISVGIKPATSPTVYSFAVTNNQVSNTGVRLSNGAIVSLPQGDGDGINLSGPENKWRSIAPYTNPNLQISANSVSNSGQEGILFGNGLATVSNNIVEDSCRVVDDCGAIYTFGNMTGSTVSGNIMVNSYGNANGRPVGTESLAQGLYLDDLTQGVSVIGNTVVNAADTLQLHRAFGNTFQRNTFYGARRYGMWFQEDNHTYTGAGGVIVNNKISDNNIVFPFSTNPPLRFDSNFGDIVTQTTPGILVPDPNTFDNTVYNGLYTDLVAQDLFRDPTSSDLVLNLAQWQPIRDPGIALFGPFAIQPYRNIQSVLPPPNNLISNGNFNTDITGWWTWSGVVTRQATCGTSTSGGCLKFVTNATSSGAASNTFSVTQGKTYLVEFKASSDVNNVNLNAVLRRNDNANELSRYQWIISNTAWKRFGIVFKATDTRSNARLDIDAPANQVVYLDDVSITEVTADEHTDYAADSRILVNKDRNPQPFACPDADKTRCSAYIDLNGNAVDWSSVTVPGYSSKIVVWSANPFKDSDRDGVTDGEDACPQSTQSVDAANASGCAPTDLGVSLSASGSSVLVGDTVTYVLTLRNNGPEQAGKVNAMLSLPAGLTLLTAPSGCTTNANTVTCAVGAMANMATVNVTFTARTGTVGSFTATASFTGAGMDTNAANNIASVTTTGLSPCSGGSYKITGAVRKNSSSGSRIGGVAMRLNGTGCGQFTTTTTQSDYAFTNLKNGSYTVTPSKTGCTFTPTTRSVSISNGNVSGWSKTGFAGSGVSCN